MELTVNGEDRQVANGVTVSGLLESMGLPDRGIAVAVGGEVFPRSRWGEPLSPYADVDVLTAVQGG
ncbi:sulfur carrier protein ThiS [Tsukamurella sp. 8F]|uniref:sulfur carrier protein ThiS n=1 Tax=unclassified Tsukamurella TaxID=2633480 RepID=UPI0023B8CFAF|nr:MULTISPECIES: sulfur carrier protein ThiS [unclassified Tsukamurella]MDF0529529.1 sulfur carrier protein ThiS [Tsukamurella sp. 8J]MDF0585783.1 sulfur carrier protein ThiS [Tsukamurella sp. 8F]